MHVVINSPPWSWLFGWLFEASACRLPTAHSCMLRNSYRRERCTKFFLRMVTFEELLAGYDMCFVCWCRPLSVVVLCIWCVVVSLCIVGSFLFVFCFAVWFIVRTFAFFAIPHPLDSGWMAIMIMTIIMASSNQQQQQLTIMYEPLPAIHIKPSGPPAMDMLDYSTHLVLVLVVRILTYPHQQGEWMHRSVKECFVNQRGKVCAHCRFAR